MGRRKKSELAVSGTELVHADRETEMLHASIPAPKNSSGEGDMRKLREEIRVLAESNSELDTKVEVLIEFFGEVNDGLKTELDTKVGVLIDSISKLSTTVNFLLDERDYYAMTSSTLKHEVVKLGNRLDETLGIYNSGIIFSERLEEINERKIQLWLQSVWGGDIEVGAGTGMADLVTSEEIVEIKVARLWKHALGQLYAYREFFRDLKPVIYLFGDIPKASLEEAVYNFSELGFGLYHQEEADIFEYKILLPPK